MAYFRIDEDGHREHATLKEALLDAAECIEFYRDACDPEWSGSVEDIAIYVAPSGCDDPEENGTLIYKAQAVNEAEAPEGSGCDFFCDYEMLPAKGPAS